MKVGSRILMNDGEVELIVEKVGKDKIETKVKAGGNISSHKGELTRRNRSFTGYYRER